MLHIVPRTVREPLEGFVTCRFNLLHLLDELVVLKGAYNLKRANTGLRDEDWKALIGPDVFEQVEKISQTLGNLSDPKPPAVDEKTGTEKKIQQPPPVMGSVPIPEDLRPIVALVSALDARLNEMVQLVPLNADGQQASKVTGLEANKNGGFKWLADAKAFLPAWKGKMARKSNGTYQFPDSFEDFEETGKGSDPSAVGERFARLTIALATDRLSGPGAKSVWGTGGGFWDANDIRNRQAGLIERKRTMNVLYLGIACRLQPYLLLFRNVFNFITHDNVKVKIERHVEPSSWAQLVAMGSRIVGELPLMPIASEVDRLNKWTTLRTINGDHDAYAIDESLFGAIKTAALTSDKAYRPADALLTGSSPFIKLMKALDKWVSIGRNKEGYDLALAMLGRGADKPHPGFQSPLMPEPVHTDGLYGTEVPRDVLSMMLTPMYPATDHNGDLINIVPLVKDRDSETGDSVELDRQRAPFLLFRPDLSVFEGELEQINSPKVWRVFDTRGSEYQGDAGQQLEDAAPERFAERLGITKEELLRRVSVDKADWAHLYSIVEVDKEKKLEPVNKATYFYRSDVTERWQWRAWQPPFLAPMEFIRWQDGESTFVTLEGDLGWLHHPGEAGAERGDGRSLRGVLRIGRQSVTQSSSG